MESKVGTVYLLRFPLLNNRRGTPGVCYRTSETKDIGEEVHLVFPNEEWDSFDLEEEERFLIPFGKTSLLKKCETEEDMLLHFALGGFSHIWEGKFEA
jgi:hypothetical protein